ncbi:MAG: RidA family protein [Planctomycetota bacterium]|jgi:enamine deaminase RidA (YjgF/YER057c/UK114 family)
MTIETKIQKLGFELPSVTAPVGVYVPTVRSGNLIYTAGQIATANGKLVAAGKVPTEVSLEAARAAAAQAALNALAVVKGEIGSLDNIARIVRLNVFVNSAPGFTDQAMVANGASELLEQIFGEAGRHTRCAIGAAELPLNSPVELDLIIEAK